MLLDISIGSWADDLQRCGGGGGGGSGDDSGDIREFGVVTGKLVKYLRPSSLLPFISLTHSHSHSHSLSLSLSLAVSLSHSLSLSHSRCLSLSLSLSLSHTLAVSLSHPPLLLFNVPSLTSARHVSGMLRSNFENLLFRKICWTLLTPACDTTVLPALSGSRLGLKNTMTSSKWSAYRSMNRRQYAAGPRGHWREG